MVLHEIRTKCSGKSDLVRLFPVGDIHLGSSGCETDSLRSVLREIERDPCALWLGMGDYAEFINIGDKRFDQRSVAEHLRARLHELPRACLDELVEMFEPVKKKCLGLLVGNHEEKLRLRDSNDVQGALCVALGVKNLGYDSLIRWTFERSTVARSSIVVMASHGTIAGRKEGAKTNRMSDVASNFDCDLALFGHGHSKIISERVELGLPRSGELKLVERKKLVVMTGTFRRNHQEGSMDYAEKAGYPPVPIGCPVVEIRPWADPRHRFRVSL